MDLTAARRRLPAEVRGPEARVAAGCLVLMWLAQVVTPLFARGHRQVPTTVVVVLLAAAAGAATAAVVGWRRAAAAVVLATAAGFAVEAVGTRSGLPFGTYRYTAALGPQLAGVPLVVALAWSAMGLPAWAVAGRLVRRLPARIAVGAAGLTGWDLFLDPQMVGEGYWAWPGGGFYRGIPLSNFAGWLLASALLMALFAAAAPGRGAPVAAAAYLLMAVMEVLGFLLFFGDAVVAVAGGLACVPLGVVAVARGRGG
jgi:putative membrane protein